MRIRQIKFDAVLFTIDNARVWNNQLSPYWPNEFGGQTTDVKNSTQTWRDELGERAYAAWFTQALTHFSPISLTQSYRISETDNRPEIHYDGQDY